MSDHKRIDDKDLEDVSGAGDIDIQEDPGNVSIQPRTGPPQPDAPGGGGPDPESEGGGGGNEDLAI